MKLIFLKSLSTKTFVTWYFPMIIIFVLLVASSAKVVDSSTQLPNASEIFNKAIEAESTVDYVGKKIVILWHPPRSSAFEERVIHQAPSTNVIEVLMPTEMSSPRDRPRRMLPSPPPRKLQDIWETDTQLLLRNYTVDIAEGETIAGQNTYLLQINPKVVSRPKKKVWVDTQNYIILRMEDYDIAEKLNSLSVYTTIDYDSTSVAKQLKHYQEKQAEKEPKKETNRPRPYQSEEVSFAEAEKQFGAKLPQPSHLPDGFQLQSISVMTFRGKRVHFRYTDGLTVFSLFISKVGDEEKERRRREVEREGQENRRGRGDRFGRNKPKTVMFKDVPIFINDQGHIRILQWKMNEQSEQEGLRFALIGELSQEEMMKVVESLIL